MQRPVSLTDDQPARGLPAMFPTLTCAQVEQRAHRLLSKMAPAASVSSRQRQNAQRTPRCRRCRAARHRALRGAGVGAGVGEAGGSASDWLRLLLLSIPDEGTDRDIAHSSRPHPPYILCLLQVSGHQSFTLKWDRLNIRE